MMDPQAEAYHLLRCLILTAMADSVLADAEAEVLDHSVRALGRVDADLWERTWNEMQRNDPSPEEVFGQVPANPRLRRFILREMAGIAMADGDFPPQERQLMAQAAAAFDLKDELERFISWAMRAQEVFEEGEALLVAP